jgi:putative sigma-54 modulation protein
MKILTTVRHGELDPEDRLHAAARIEKLQRYARDLHEAHLVVTVEKHRYLAEITLRLKHHEIVSREEADRARIAVDRTVDRLEEQQRRLKEKRVDRTHRPGAARDGTPPAAATGEETQAEEDLA